MKYVTTRLRRYRYLQTFVRFTLLLLLSPLWLLAVAGEGSKLIIGFFVEYGNKFVRWIAHQLDWDSEAMFQKEMNPDKFKF